MTGSWEAGMMSERGSEGMLIRDVWVPVGEGTGLADVEVEVDRIGQVVYKGDQNGDAAPPQPEKLLLPGMVNAHTHSSQVWQRGLIPQLPLELWLVEVFESTPRDLQQFYWGAISTAVDTLLSGGTCVIDHAYVVPGQELETIAALVRGYRQVGIRAVIAPLLQDLPFAAGLPKGCTLPQQSGRSATELLALMEAIVQQFHDPASGIYIAMGPTGFHRCSDDMLAGFADLSQRHQLCLHMHLLETRAQQQLATERYGKSAVQHLQSLGCLGDCTTLAHSVWLTPTDIEILAATGATVVHNPVSNLRLGSGIAPILDYLQAGVRVAFGCDGAASNDAQDLLEAIKLGTILHTLSDPDYQRWLSPPQVLQMATQNGAHGIGLGDVLGSITPGKLADLVLYDLSQLSMLPLNDPLQLLVLGRPTNVVEQVWVNGRSIVQDGQVQTVDMAALKAELRDRSRYCTLSSRSTGRSLLNQIEAHYRATLLD